MQYTRSEILRNRQKWINLLVQPETKRHRGALESSTDHQARCCLGHACHVLELERISGVDREVYYRGDVDERYYMPSYGIDMLGLWDRAGASKRKEEIVFIGMIYQSLAHANDRGAMPQQIGRYLQTVIEGGENTPFRPLSDYPETI